VTVLLFHQEFLYVYNSCKDFLSGPIMNKRRYQKQ